MISLPRIVTIDFTDCDDLVTGARSGPVLGSVHALIIGWLQHSSRNSP
jgi:hypothetical protein